MLKVGMRVKVVKITGPLADSQWASLIGKTGTVAELFDRLIGVDLDGGNERLCFSPDELEEIR